MAARLLLLTNTTGYQTTAFRDAAHKMGITLSLASDRCHVLEDPWRDGAIAVKFQDPRESANEIVKFARANKLEGIVALGDVTTSTAALVAAELNLPFHSPQAVDACRNKWLARERYKTAKMLVPWFTRFPHTLDPATAASEAPFPCVLKPLGLSGSRGVIRANDREAFARAFKRIAALMDSPDIQIRHDDNTKWIQVEGYIPGHEFAVEGLVTQGRLRVLALFDKPDPLEGPFFEETIYVTPSRQPRTVQNDIYACVQKAVAALGLSHGPLHAEVRYNEKGAWMLETAARPIGGLCSRALKFDSWMSLEELILRHALGEPVDHLPREKQASGVMMIPIPQAGFYEGVEGVDQARRVPGIAGIEITAKERQKIVPLPEGSSYLGFIFARSDAPEEVESSLRRAHSMLRFQISAELPVI